MSSLSTIAAITFVAFAVFMTGTYFFRLYDYHTMKMKHSGDRIYDIIYRELPSHKASIVMYEFMLSLIGAGVVAVCFVFVFLYHGANLIVAFGDMIAALILLVLADGHFNNLRSLYIMSTVKECEEEDENRP